MSEARPWTDVDLSHLKNVECTTTYDLLVCERAADHIRTLEAVQADLLAHIRDLETQLARLEREFVRFYQVAHQASRGSEGPLAVLRSALEWLEAQDWFRRIKEAGDE